MFKPIHCIALRNIRHNDKMSILTVYTREDGRLALALPASGGKSASRLRALTMPLSVFECLIDERPGKEIYNFKNVLPELSECANMKFMHEKNCISFFLADFFNAVLREQMPDPKIFDFVKNISYEIQAADSRNKLANIHIQALRGTTVLLGIEPDLTGSDKGNVRFNMSEGRWTTCEEGSSKAFLTQEASDILKRIFVNPSIGENACLLNRNERNLVVDTVLSYLSFQGYPVENLTSLSIVRECMI